MANLQYKFSKQYGGSSLETYLREKLSDVEFNGGYHILIVDNCNVVEFVQGYETDCTPIAMNTDVIPSKKTIEDEMVVYEKSAVARFNRRQEYPLIGDQLDDLYKQGAFSDAMTAQLKTIKDKHPKG